MAIRTYQDLEVWRQGMELAHLVYDLTEKLPRDERFGLTDQIKRAAVSVPINIAEGRARGSTKEFVRFVSIASESLAEVETLLLFTQQRGFVKESQIQPALALAETLTRKLNALRASLKRRL